MQHARNTIPTTNRKIAARCCRTQLWTILFLAGLLSISELLARTDMLKKFAPIESLGTFHPQFEIKWFRLQQFIAENDGVDVIIFGSSLANTGIDPDIMAQTYYAQTGIPLRIFNFGVEGMSVAPGSLIERILTEKYHPALILLITEMREFHSSGGLNMLGNMNSDPWFEHQAGKFNLVGWLIDHSAALKHFLPYRNWMRADFPQSIHFYRYRSQSTSASGYEPDNAVGTNLTLLPDLNNPNDKYYYDIYQGYQIAAFQLACFQKTLDLQKNGETQVIVVEMPVEPSFYFYVGGEAVHQQFQQVLASTIAESGAVYIPASKTLPIPENGRADRVHLNKNGAPIFSDYLGLQLSILTNSQGLRFDLPAGDGGSH
jgi:hypothetical protein